MGRVNTNMKAKSCKQSVARGRGPSSAPPPPRAPSPAHSPRRLGRRLPPFPLPAPPHEAPLPAPPPSAPPRGPPDTEPGPALRAAARPQGPLGRGGAAAASPRLAQQPHRSAGSSSPGGAAGAGDGERMAREPPRSPPPAPPRAAPPALSLTRRWCVSCWSCNRRLDRGGGAWTWRWRSVCLSGGLSVWRSVCPGAAGGRSALPPRAAARRGTADKMAAGRKRRGRARRWRAGPLAKASPGRGPEGPALPRALPAEALPGKASWRIGGS